MKLKYAYASLFINWHYARGVSSLQEGSLSICIAMVHDIVNKIQRTRGTVIETQLSLYQYSLTCFRCIWVPLRVNGIITTVVSGSMGRKGKVFSYRQTSSRYLACQWLVTALPDADFCDLLKYRQTHSGCKRKLPQQRLSKSAWGLFTWELNLRTLAFVRRGPPTKEDGRLSPELRAAAVPRRRRGPCGGRKITLTHVETLPQPRASDPNLNNRPPRPCCRQRAWEGKGKKWPTERAEPRLFDQKTGSLKDGGTQLGRP
ncbi:hypothetical protein NDU88_003753 [Pleurodeles waltl]|uniref:Uncharacterized protein n=1 Tax=Pleurodeles waltl TaxID=8319 RepID=A0AAV7MVH8_PLEWA|nr:hypothetical protein NDU88_003753 [Pleurodeles waltl]